MKSNFVKVTRFLEQNFPNDLLQIEGGLYPAPPIAEFAMNVLSFFQFTALAWMVLGGDKILRMVGFRSQLPGFYYTITDNGVALAIFIFLIAPQLIQRLGPQGAFELFLDGKEIFSRLKTGNFPGVDDLVKPLKAVGLAFAGDAAATATASVQ
jgi:thioredoxin reductase-like selenoprotein T